MSEYILRLVTGNTQFLRLFSDCIVQLLFHNRKKKNKKPLFIFFNIKVRLFILTEFNQINSRHFHFILANFITSVICLGDGEYMTMLLILLIDRIFEHQRLLGNFFEANFSTYFTEYHFKKKSI